MTAGASFLVAAGLLTALAVAWLVLPLIRSPRESGVASRRALNAAIYRDQLAELERDRATGALAEADYAQARDELQHRLLLDAATEDGDAASGRTTSSSSKGPALALILLLPLLVALLYYKLGNPASLDPASHEPQLTAGQIDEMVAKLAARMEQNPDDPRGWIMLARSYKALHRFDDAEKAFAKIGPMLDENPDLLIEYADMRVIRDKGAFNDKTMDLIRRALAVEPAHPMALALAGSAAYNRKDFAGAVRHWEALLAVLPADSEDARALAETLAETRQKAEPSAKEGKRPGKATAKQ